MYITPDNLPNTTVEDLLDSYYAFMRDHPEVQLPTLDGVDLNLTSELQVQSQVLLGHTLCSEFAALHKQNIEPKSSYEVTSDVSDDEYDDEYDDDYREEDETIDAVNVTHLIQTYQMLLFKMSYDSYLIYHQLRMAQQGLITSNDPAEQKAGAVLSKISSLFRKAR